MVIVKCIVGSYEFRLMEEIHLKSHNTARGLCSGALAKQACDTSSGKESQGPAEVGAGTRVWAGREDKLPGHVGSREQA